MEEVASIKTKRNYLSLSIVGLALLSITAVMIQSYQQSESAQMHLLHWQAWPLLALILLISFVALLFYPLARHSQTWKIISLICPLLCFIATIIIALLSFDGNVTLRLVLGASIGLLASATSFF